MPKRNKHHVRYLNRPMWKGYLSSKHPELFCALEKASYKEPDIWLHLMVAHVRSKYHKPHDTKSLFSCNASFDSVKKRNEVNSRGKNIRILDTIWKKQQQQKKKKKKKKKQEAAVRIEVRGNQILILKCIGKEWTLETIHKMARIGRQYEPRHEKTCLCYMRTTKAQISLRSLISAFVVRCQDSIIPLVSKSEIASLYLASVVAQAGLRLTWSKTPKTGFLVTWFICGKVEF